MKYISLDIETTSLVPSERNILQVAMVFEDTEQAHIPIDELPYFCCLVRHEVYSGQAFALQMNAWIFKELCGWDKGQSTVYPVYDDNEWAIKAHDWIADLRTGINGRLTVAGKNVAGFDMQFMPDLIKQCFRHRVIDVGSVYFDSKLDYLPALSDIIKAPVTHDALHDARDVIVALRKKYK